MTESRKPTPSDIFYDAALDTFAEQGVKRTNAQLIATTAGVPIPEEITLHGEIMLRREVYERSWAVINGAIESEWAKHEDPNIRMHETLMATWSLQDDEAAKNAMMLAFPWSERRGRKTDIVGADYESQGESRFNRIWGSLVNISANDLPADRIDFRTRALQNYITFVHLAWLLMPYVGGFTKDEAHLGAMQIIRGERDGQQT